MKLTDNQRAIVVAVANSVPRSDIAFNMGLSVKQVGQVIEDICRKLRFPPHRVKEVMLTRWAIANNLVSL